MKFTPPFQVQDGVIYDRDGRKVKLWGVNYYAPFNHNYYNIAELGKDHFAAIDEDIRHFKLLGVELVRMHLYDREITDRDGDGGKAGADRRVGCPRKRRFPARPRRIHSFRQLLMSIMDRESPAAAAASIKRPPSASSFSTPVPVR